MKARFLLLVLTLFSFSFIQLKGQNERPPMGMQYPFFIQPASQINTLNAGSFFESVFDMDEEDDFRLVDTQKDQLGYTHEIYQQYYAGIKVEGALYKAHANKGVIELLSGHYYDIFEEVNTTPSVREFAALAAALNHVKGKKYLTETPGEMPKAELVIFADPLGLEAPLLAYKFDIYSLDPLYRAYIFIDAHEGTFITEHPIIHHSDIATSGSSQYNGTVNFTADFTGSGYRLRQQSLGSGVETYSLNNGTSYSLATDITSNTPFFTSDDTGVQAHWGAEQTYKYFLERHSRNSYNGNGALIRSYVHYGFNYVNAFWDGSRMTYGDGDGQNYGPLVSLDIVGHELSHGVTQYTAGLIYQNESGALNESFSDIFGEAIERFASGSNDWLLGHEIGINTSGAFRSIQNPKAFRDPDTYQGQYWYTGAGDNGGVHINSGVQNKWFYILSEGETGTNDHGDAYSVSGLGIEKAAAIAYRNLSVYLSPSSNYFDARLGAIQAAKDLYGADAPEVIATTNAWYAVGVGGEYGSTDYCSSSGRNAQYEWIANVEIGDFSNTSGSANYSDFTSQKIELFPNNNYSVRLSPDFSGTLYKEWWKIWIDFNIDGDFDDPGELVYDSEGLSSTTVTGIIRIPGNAFGETRLRVSMKYEGEQTSPCEIFPYGEVEDYTVSFSTSNDNEPPTAPPNLTASNITETSFKLNWSASTDNAGVTLYKVYLNGSLYGSTNTRSYTLTGLDPSTTYTASVTAADDAGNESNPSTIQVRTLGGGDNVPPNPPASVLALNTTTTSTQLFWSVATDNIGVTGYKVYVNNALYATTTNTNLVVNGLNPSTTYLMSVSAVDAAGNESARKSISVTTLDIVDTEAPTTPTNLTASNTSAYSTLLSWSASSDNVGVNTYRVYRGNTLVGSTSSTNFQVTGLSPATTYTFYVRAEDAAGNKSGFAWVQVTTRSLGDTQPPSQPGNLTASNTKMTSTQLSWSAASDNVGVTGYRIYVNNSLKGTTTNLSYSVTGLSSGTTYTLKVTATDAAGNESIPASINVTTLSESSEGTAVLLGAYYFENGWDGWTDGGYDCDRYQGPFSWEGEYSIRIRDNSGEASTMISPIYDLRNFITVELEFAFYARSMEAGEAFHVKFWDGNIWHTLATYTSGIDFLNGNFYGISISTNSGEFNLASNSRFGIQCDASADSDQIYIDAVVIKGMNGGAPNAFSSSMKPVLKTPMAAKPIVAATQKALLTNSGWVDTIEAINIYPNPVKDQLNIDLPEQVEWVRLLDLQGRVLKEIQFPGQDRSIIDVSGLNTGLYILYIQTAKGTYSKKLIKQ